MDETVYTLQRGKPGYPSSFNQLHKPPEALHYRGDLLSLLSKPRVAIVGTRRPTAYGQQVTRQLAHSLAERGIVIVSGLALGVDAIAHQAAINAGGLTMAILPSPVTHIVPATHHQLAGQILKHHGALVSTYADVSPVYKANFVARNEIVAALSNTVLITEASAQSGTRHTAAFAWQLQIPVMAVPGPINSSQSAGTNSMLRTPDAYVATCTEDVLHILGIQPTKSARRTTTGDTPEQQQILSALVDGPKDGQALLTTTGLPIQTFNQTLTLLEISAKITPLGGNVWGLA